MAASAGLIGDLCSAFGGGKEAKCGNWVIPRKISATLQNHNFLNTGLHFLLIRPSDLGCRKYFFLCRDPLRWPNAPLPQVAIVTLLDVEPISDLLTAGRRSKTSKTKTLSTWATKEIRKLKNATSTAP